MAYREYAHNKGKVQSAWARQGKGRPREGHALWTIRREAGKFHAVFCLAKPRGKLSWNRFSRRCSSGVGASPTKAIKQALEAMIERM